MTESDKVDEQWELAEELTDEWQSDGLDLGTLELLDYLAICGFKLKRMIPSDFDSDGVSIVSRAYFGVLQETGLGEVDTS